MTEQHSFGANVADDTDEFLRKRDEFSDFVRNVLRPEYDAALKLERTTKDEIAEYEQLLQYLEQRSDGTRQDGNATASSRVSTESKSIRMDQYDLGGHGIAFCPVAVDLDDTAYVVVHLGTKTNDFVEFTHSEALTYVRRRIDYLSRHVLPYRATKVKKVQGHIQTSEQMLDALSAELRK